MGVTTAKGASAEPLSNDRCCKASVKTLEKRAENTKRWLNIGPTSHDAVPMSPDSDFLMEYVNVNRCLNLYSSHLVFGELKWTLFPHLRRASLFVHNNKRDLNEINCSEPQIRTETIRIIMVVYHDYIDSTRTPELQDTTGTNELSEPALL